MSVSRQYGLHEIPGTEEEAPNRARQVSATFEGQMRDYIGAIWVELAELKTKVTRLEEFRDEIGYRLASPGPLSSVAPPARRGNGPLAPAPATGEGYGDGSVQKTGARAPSPKPWEAEGVSKATWYRRQKGQAA